MPNIQSAVKAMRQSARRRLVNLKTKEKYRDALKNFRKLVLQKKVKEAEEAMHKAAAQIDKALKKNMVHANKASRLKSRMAASLKKIMS